MEKLNRSLKKPKEEGQYSCEQVGAINSTIEGVSDKAGEAVKSDSEEQISLAKESSEHALGVLSDDDSAIKTEYFGLEEDEEPNLISMAAPADDGSLTSSEETWRSFDSDCLFDQSSTGYQWWDFWC